MNLFPNASIANRFISTLEHLPFGTLTVTMPDGKVRLFEGEKPGPQATLQLYDWSVIRNATLRGDIGLGEDYIAGLWDSDNIETLFSLFLINMDTLENYAHGDWLRRAGFIILNRILRRNNKKGSRQNIEAHYDVGNEFYKLWLDESMTYSSALFAGGTEDLAEAQASKYKRILNTIDNDASSVLEIGCGWGGFAEQASAQSRHVTGLTVSPSQKQFAQARLGEKAEIRLQDYRDCEGLYDAIVSIEMFEAVGERYWPVYFGTIRERLKKGGKAVIQTITIRDEFFEGYRTRSDFIRHYVFPGGMLPSLQSFTSEAAKAGLKCNGVFSFGQDYAKTLRKWLANFENKREEMRQMGYSEAFIRNWKFYLGICAATFAVERTNVIQAELVHA